MNIRVALLLFPAIATSLTPAETDFFENRIRPVFATQCFSCHTNSKLGGLRLETRADLLKGGKSGPAILPGEPDKSLLIQAVRHAGELRMPKSVTKLTDAEIADLTKWVKDGAYWPDDAKPERANGYTITAAQRRFWSIQPLQRPEIPKPKNAAWPLTSIDRFVLARLEKAGLEPAPSADRRTLLRRITYDLTGLPPTFAEVKAFEADSSPDAWQKVVDRLLASPHYGERWARHWLDVVRYGEDDYRISQKPERVERYPHAYTYRDWVIKAFNDDLPYDQFIKAQLAADLMDPKVRDRFIPGLGMNGLGVWQWNANVAAIERADEWADKVDVTTKAFLGLTVGCARCHDHKYDPIPTKDYYRLAGVFASSQFHPYALAPKAVVDSYDKAKEQLEEKEKDLKEYLDKASALHAEALLAQTEEYMVAAFQVETRKRATVASVAEESRLDAEILDRWIRFLRKKPSNYSYLTPWQALVKAAGPLEEARKLAREFHAKAVAINKLREKVRAENELALAKMKDPEEKFDPLPNGLKRKLTKYQVDLKGLDREQSYLWKDMFDQDLSDFVTTVDIVDKEVPGLLKLTGHSLEKRLSGEMAAHVARLQKGIDEHKKAMPPQYPFVYGIRDHPEPADLKVYVRGNPAVFGEDAPRGFLAMLSEGEPKPFSKGSGRLELAEAIAAQPIAARVMVNRVWRWHMGSGLVETPNNFGLVGEKPSNPELLEYLADRFTSNGFSLKKLHREILLSRVYQLSATSIEANEARDGANRLYWRANRRRVEAEGVWDLLLSASGQLDTARVGGPSQDLVPGMTRRGVYGQVSRMYPNQFQLTFDFPTPTISAERRYATNVPQQRLFFLNSDFVRKQADQLADRVKTAGTPEQQVRKAFEIVYQRPPAPNELTTLLQPETPVSSICWVLLSSNEFLFLN